MTTKQEAADLNAWAAEAATEADAEKEEFAEAWRHESLNPLLGTVVRINERPARDDYAGYSVVTVMATTGELLAVHCLHSVLADQIKNAQAGDWIWIRYDGLRQSKSGREYHAYSSKLHTPDQGESLPI